LAVPACEDLASAVFDTAAKDVAAMASVDDAEVYIAVFSEAVVSPEAADAVLQA